MKIAFIGFGEVGQTFAVGFLRNPGISIAAWDILLGSPAGDDILAKATPLGVKMAEAASLAAEGAEVIISAVTADQCEAVALHAASFIAKGQYFLDVNSASPQTKRRAGQAIEAAGGSYVEAAVMAPVLAPGLAVPILAGGTRAAEFATAFNPLGMNITPVSTKLGQASATKLCRSIIIKGLEALLSDCAMAAHQTGVSEDVFASLSKTFPSIDWADLADTMAERIAKHGKRRASEMREAAEMLDELGMDGQLARAVATRQDQGYRG